MTNKAPRPEPGRGPFRRGPVSRTHDDTEILIQRGG